MYFWKKKLIYIIVDVGGEQLSSFKEVAAVIIYLAPIFCLAGVVVP